MLVWQRAFTYSVCFLFLCSISAAQLQTKCKSEFMKRWANPGSCGGAAGYPQVWITLAKDYYWFVHGAVSLHSATGSRVSDRDEAEWPAANQEDGLGRWREIERRGAQRDAGNWWLFRQWSGRREREERGRERLMNRKWRINERESRQTVGLFRGSIQQKKNIFKLNDSNSWKCVNCRCD